MEKLGLLQDFDSEKYSLVQDLSDIAYFNKQYETNFEGFLIEFSHLGPENLLGISGTGYNLEDEIYFVSKL